MPGIPDVAVATCDDLGFLGLRGRTNLGDAEAIARVYFRHECASQGGLVGLTTTERRRCALSRLSLAYFAPVVGAVSLAVCAHISCLCRWQLAVAHSYRALRFVVKGLADRLVAFGSETGTTAALGKWTTSYFHSDFRWPARNRLCGEFF
eukprot:scaffold12742_cov20-Prasinocladus_malaysianus.AAC.1